MRTGGMERAVRFARREAGGGIFALRSPRPYSRHLRGHHCDPNVTIAATPHAPHEPVVFITTRHAASLRSSRNGIA